MPQCLVLLPSLPLTPLQSYLCIAPKPLLQAPSVDLEALTRQLEEMHSQVDDQVGRQGGGLQRDGPRVVGSA